MNASSGALSFEAIIKDINFKAQLDVMERRILGLSNTAVRETSRIDSAFQSLGKLAAGAFAFQGLADLPQQILKVRAEFESLEIAFGTMLKSKEKGNALLTDLAKEAATTPFGLKDLASGAKQLLAYGSSAGNLVKELHMLGDVASGVSAPINDLIYLYGTLRTQGRAYATDIRQFAGRGIPIYAELAKVLKINVDQVNKFVEDGKVGFKEVEQAFKNMTKTGGLFAGLMDAQSKSLKGLQERLGDAWDMMLNDIGKKNQNIATELFSTATNVVEHYQEVIDILKVVVSVYGGYRAALLLVTTAQRANLIFMQTMAVQQGIAALSGNVLSASQLRLAATTSLLSRAQAALNTTMLANPYILVGTAIAALVSYAILFDEETKKLTTSQQYLADAVKEVDSNYNKQKGEINTLIGIIKNQHIAESERYKAYEKLKSIAPDILRNLDFEKAKTTDLTKAADAYLASLKKRIQLQVGENKVKEAYDQQTEAAERLKKAQEEVLRTRNDNFKPVIGVGGINGPVFAPSNAEKAKRELDQAVKDKQKADQIVAEMEGNVANIYAGTASKEELEANLARQERIMAALPDKLSPAYKNAEEAANAYRKELAKLAEDEKKEQQVRSRGIEQIEEEIKAKKKELLDTNTDAQNAAIHRQIDKLEKEKARLEGKKTKAEKDAEKVGPYGSISYWENVSKKMDELIQKTPSTDTTKLQELNNKKLDADQKAEAIRKALAQKSFEEELAEKERLYKLYVQWTEAYGKEAADAQFSDLIKTGKSYLEYINIQIANLENERDNAGLTPSQTTNLGSLIDQRNAITGKKTNLDVFNEGLQEAQRQAGNLAEYLDILNQKQAELDTKTPVTTEDFAIRKALADAKVQVQQDLRQQLVQYVQDVEGSEAKRLAITKKYADLRAGLEEEYANKFKDETYKIAAKTITKQENLEIAEFKNNAVKATDSFKKLDEVIVESGRAAMKRRLELLNKFLEENKTKLDTQDYQIKLKEKNDVLTSLKSDDLARVNEYGQLVGQLGEALTELGGDAANAGGFLTGLASQVNLVTKAFEDNLSKAQLVQIGLQGAVNILTTITTAAAQRKNAETAYYASLIAQQQQYNLLLNEQYGIQAQNAANGIFGRDYLKELKADFNQFDDAQKKYQESLKKLSDGKAKEGLKNVLDTQSALSLIGSGAATGAAIGALVGGVAAPVTAAIGAIGGAIVGGLSALFGGATKKADEFGALLERYPNLIQKSKDGVDELNVSLAQSLLDNNLLDEATQKLVKSSIEWQKQVQAARDAILAVVKDLVGELGDKLGNSLVTAFKDGTDAAMAFKGTLEDILESFVTKLLYSKVLGPYLEQFGKDVEIALAGDGDITAAVAKLYSKSGELTQKVDKYLQQAQDGAKAQGFNILQNAVKNDTSSNSLNNAIKGITEETASVLAGQMNAIRITQADSNAIIRQQLLVLSNIDRSSAVVAQNSQYLQSIDKQLGDIKASLKDGTRGLGLVP